MRYAEVIRAPLWLIAFVYFLFLSVVLSIWAALGNNPALAAFIALTGWLVYLYFRTALKIEIDETEIRVGSARIEHRYLGGAKALDNAALKLIRTRDADPAAFLAIRFWASSAVKIELNDKRDPTPYWLVTSNTPEKLLAALKL